MSEEKVTIEGLDEAKGPSTKSELLALVMQHIGGMKKADLEQFVKAFSDAIPSGTADRNRATLAMKPSAASASMKEDVESLFGDADLTEEFKEKTTTLFEAAVTSRVEMIKAELEESFEEKHDAEVKESIDELHSNVNSYLDYVVEQWIEKNQVELESNYRTQVSEQFLSGLRNLFAENYVEVPEDKVDLVAELQEQVSSLKDSLESIEAENIQLNNAINESKRSEVIKSLSNDLTETQIEKFTTLIENIDFDVEDKFREKAEMIKEQYFVESDSSDEKTETGLINEEESIGSNDVSDEHKVPQEMRAYVDSISRTIRK